MTAITVYTVTIGAALFCGPAVADVDVAWVALPYRDHGTGWQCGDTIVITDADGTLHTLLALDTGPFGAFCVEQPGGECLPIAADVPEPWAWFPGLSTTGTVHNATAHREHRNQQRGD